jgi:predicted XRE-type DNA-binding protein
MSKAKTKSFASVWEAVADTPEEAANLRVRSEVMSRLAAIVRDKGWTQAQAANRCGVTQPRINDLVRGRLSRFSLDALVNIASSLGQHVRIELGGTSQPETKGVGGASHRGRDVRPQASATRASGRLHRWSTQDVPTALETVVALLKKSPAGLRAEDIRQELAMRSNEMSRVLKEGLTKKKIRAKGQQRSITYTSAG